MSIAVGIDCRILHYAMGGISVYARSLVDAIFLLPRSRDVTWVTLESRKASQDELVALPSNARRLRMATPSHHPLEQLILPLELRNRGLDVLHSVDFIPPFRRNFRSVITVHDLAFLDHPEFLTGASNRYYGQIHKALRSADLIIAVSEATKQDIIEVCPESAEKIHVIYEAAGPEFQPIHDPDALERFRTRYQLPEDYVLFVGTREPRKNLQRLIDAFLSVRGMGYTGKLVLVGPGGWCDHGISTAMREGGEAVLALGPVPRGDLPFFYSAAKILAFPSIYEGFGLPVLESMSCGTPVLTSQISSLAEIAGDAAVLVDPHSEEEIAKQLWRLLQDGVFRNELGEKGISRAGQFSWWQTAEATLTAYLSLL